MYFRSGNTRLYFDVEGSELVAEGNRLAGKPTLVALHGSLVCHSYYKPALSPLAEHCQILYPDCRGFGRSDPSEKSEWNFAQLAKDVLALLDHLEIERAYILAHSMSCNVSVQLALMAPERVAGLVLLNPVFLYLSAFYQNLLERIGEPAKRAAIRVFEHQDMAAVEEYVSLVLPHLSNAPLPPEMLARGSMNLDMAVHLMPQHYQHDLLQEVAQLKTPTLICSGRRDLYSPKDMDAGLAALVNPALQVLQFADAAHFVLQDKPAETLAAIGQFIGRQ